MLERCGLGRPGGSRRCMVADEKGSVAAGADCEECWTLRLNGQGCLMCSPTNNTSAIVRKVLSYTPSAGETEYCWFSGPIFYLYDTNQRGFGSQTVKLVL